MTWNDLESSFRPTLFVRSPLVRRDRMRFLFTMSIHVGASGPLASGWTSVRPKPLKPAPPKIESPRRAIRPDEDLNNLQTDVSSEAPSPDGGWVGHELPELEVLVEPDGIEPTTSCLQSTRSPN